MWKALTAAVWLVSAAGSAMASCAPETVELKTPSETLVRFRVDLADTDAKRMRGLMFVDQMPSSTGMLFVYPAPTSAVFWMKNTLIPLDMIFVDASGTVTHVHENAIPHDETPIDGGQNVAAVLEINGGLARKLRIAEGSILRHPAFNPEIAVWPCK